MHSLGFNQVSERKKNFLYIHVIYFIPTGSDGSGHLEYLIHKKYVSKKLKLCSDYPMIIHVKFRFNQMSIYKENSYHVAIPSHMWFLRKYLTSQPIRKHNWLKSHVEFLNEMKIKKKC